MAPSIAPTPLAEEIQPRPLPGTLASENTNLFSTPSVFGLFLTIGICILVQPYGSLLYVQPQSMQGRLVFFFWRLNPVSGLLEIVLFAVAFIEGIWQRHMNLPWSTDPDSFCVQLRTTALAIQLLRSHGTVPDNFVLFATSQQHEDRVDVEETPPRHIDNSSVTGSQTSEREAASSETGTLPFAETDSTVRARLDIFSHGRTRAQTIINIISTAGMIVALIKLIAIKMPLQIRLPAAMLITEWTSVQALYLVSHTQGTESELVHDIKIIRRAEEIQRRLSSNIVWIFLSMLLVPPFSYLIFATFFAPESDLKTLHDWVELFTFWNILFQEFYIPCVMIKTFGVEGSLDLVFPSLLPYMSSLLITVYSFARPHADSARIFLHKYIQPVWNEAYGLWVCHMFPGITFMRGKSKHFAFIRSVSLLLNLLTTAYMFVAVLTMYDEDETYKPSWLDWLG